MGTRADFYVGRGPNARWVGSIAWDGHPGSITPHSEETEILPVIGKQHKEGHWPKGGHLFQSKTEKDFLSRLERFFQFRTDVTLPERGWPWPWENSNTTDYAYAFDGGKVYGTCFGHGWWLATKPEPDGEGDAPKISDWPDMSKLKNVAFGGPRSGLIVISAP